MTEKTPDPGGDPAAFAELSETSGAGELSCASVLRDPLAQFGLWMGAAVEAGIEEPNAMTLATAGADGAPSARIVLLKGLDERGFYFYTNYESRKARDLEANPRAALVLHWKPLGRQVNVRGAVEKIDRQSSEDYFHSRPYESQIGAWVSTQSQKIAGRAWLEERRALFTEKYPPGEVPLPDFWGGFVLAPSAVEFWQCRPGRLHDRILYERQSDGAWEISRLSP